MPEEILWSETDLQLAISEALDDRRVSAEWKQTLIRELLQITIRSPRAFTILWRYRQAAALASGLPERAYAASFLHPSGAWFRQWLDRVWKDQPEPKMPPLLTRSQREAREVLQASADVYFSDEYREAEIRPRTTRLIAGPSGVGKTHLLQAFAEARGLGFLRLCYGEWIPLGGRGEATKEVVARFLNEHERCLITLDELDKVGRELSGEWTTAILNELYCLLDRNWFQGSSSSDRILREKLRFGTMLVGLGTWQTLWETGPQRAMGFQEQHKPAISASLRAARTIPSELFYRFHPIPLVLAPLTAADFEDLCRATQLMRRAQAVGIQLDYEEAVRSELGFRWLEAKALEVEIEHRRRRRCVGCS